MSLLSEVTLDPDAGVSGRAMRTRQVEWTGDVPRRRAVRHTPRARRVRARERDPLGHRRAARSTATSWSARSPSTATAPDAFGEADAGLLSALADQAAVAIANARLIDELERSRAEIARRADSEQTLREIAARVSAILEPDEVLQQIVDETTRLLESDGARIDLYDPAIDALRWSYAAGDAMAVDPGLGEDRRAQARPGRGRHGLRRAARRSAPTTTSPTSASSATTRRATFVVDTGIRSVIAVPLPGEAGPIGTLSVVSRQVGAYDDADGEVLTALATQASIAIRNARLIEELARSRAVIERRAEAEQALREIAARITAIRQPGDLLQRIVDEALRLLRADGAVIDEYDEIEGVLVTAYDAGLTEEQRESVRATRLRIGEGLSGRAMAEGRVIAAGDYLAGEFQHVDRDRRARPDDRHRRPHRRADHRRRGPARRHRGLPPRASRLRRHRRGGPRRPRRPGRHRDHQRPADRGARALAGGRRPARRHGAGAARHHRPDRRAARAGGHPRPGRRGGQAPARHATART